MRAREPKTGTWRTAAAAVTLILASFLGLEMTAAPRRLSAPAGRFVYYYKTLKRGETHTGLWERVVLSLILAGARCPSSQV